MYTKPLKIYWTKTLKMYTHYIIDVILYLICHLNMYYIISYKISRHSRSTIRKQDPSNEIVFCGFVKSTTLLRKISAEGLKTRARREPVRIAISEIRSRGRERPCFVSGETVNGSRPN